MSLNDIEAALRLHCDRGADLFRAGDLDGAIAEFAAARELRDNLSLPHFYLGVAYGRQEKWSEAILELERAFELGDQDTVTFWSLGLAYSKVGRTQDAAAAFRVFLAKPDAAKDPSQVAQAERYVSQVPIVQQYDLRSGAADAPKAPSRPLPATPAPRGAAPASVPFKPTPAPVPASPASVVAGLVMIALVVVVIAAALMVGGVFRSGPFHQTGTMNLQSNGITATALADGRVLVLGYSVPPNAAPSAELYDPSTGTFSPTGAMVNPRSGHTLTLLSDGRVLVAGGTSDIEPFDMLASAELYDPKTGTFSATGSMTVARQRHTATLLPDGRVLIAGGQSHLPTNDNSGILASAELYDPATGTFSPTGSMTTPRDGHTAALLSDGRVLIAGFADDSNMSSAELYDPASGTFSSTGSMTAGRIAETATLLQDGRVLIVELGGDSNSPLAGAELYDPKAGVFNSTGSMAAARQYFAATGLKDGRVLITGGEEVGGDRLDSAELFDPTTGTFSSAGSMTTARSEHTAVPLSDGRVFIAGGNSEQAAPGSAELYQP